MEQRTKTRSAGWRKSAALLVLLTLLLLASLVAAINIGAVNISPPTVCKIIVNKATGYELFATSWSKPQESIVWQLRFPKVLVAAAVGAGLSLAGVFMQALTKNQLADPYILGISAGASTGAVLSLLFGGFWLLGSFSVQVGAFGGAMLATLLIFLLRGRGTGSGATTKLVLIGVAISAIFVAFTDLIIYLTPDSRRVAGALFWMMGSFGGVFWKDVAPVLLALSVGIVFAFFCNRELDIFLLGEDMARTYGVNVKAVRTAVMLVSALLTGVMVSVSGIIGFVGLVVPHVARSFVGSPHRRVIPVSLFGGAIFMVWADVGARIIVAPEELPIGIITAMLGGPFFLSLIKRSRYTFGG